MADTKTPDQDALSRWSRLKSESRAGAPAVSERDEAEDDRPQDAGAEADAPPAEDPAAEDLAVEDLPDVETLTYESDFTAFMRETVPEELRRLALRKLWRSNPILANLDGLNDYDLDYRNLGVDPRVAEALLAQREDRERALRARSKPAEAEPTDRMPQPVAETAPPGPATPPVPQTGETADVAVASETEPEPEA